MWKMKTLSRLENAIKRLSMLMNDTTMPGLGLEIFIRNKKNTTKLHLISNMPSASIVDP